MKSLVFLANSFHLKKTKSADFFIELLKRFFNVTVIPHKDAWLEIPKNQFDILVTWQKLYSPKELEAFQIPKVVVIPMYDDCPKDPDYWFKYKKFSVFSFSKTLHKILNGVNVKNLHLQYFPPLPIEERKIKNDIFAFFWERTSGITWSKEIKTLLGRIRPKKVFLHLAGDPGHFPEKPSGLECEEFNMVVSEWFENADDLKNLLTETNLYFSPRKYEGIGMAFLEAMAMGLCVVAPDHPTMNEYIDNGKNGILYSTESLSPIENQLSVEKINELGRNAQKSISDGRNQWEINESKIIDFIQNSFVHSPRIHAVFRLKKIISANIKNFGRKIKRLVFKN